MKRLPRNVLGEVELRIGKFFICKNYNGKWAIMKNEPWYITNAVMSDILWSEIEPFDSMIQAYKFLKQNVNQML